MDSKDPSALLYLGLSVLCAREKNSLIPEIVYILEPEQILKFIYIFEGQTLKIPKVRDFYIDLMAIMWAYFSMVEGRDVEWFKQEYTINGYQMSWIKKRLTYWIDRSTTEELDFLKKMRK